MHNYIINNKYRFLDDLFKFLRITSISSVDNFSKDIFKTVNFLKFFLLKLGFDKSFIIKNNKNPIIYSEKIINKNLPTVLLYGHYDVQSYNPYNLWDSDPFNPKIVNQKIFSRGSADDKGQVFMHIKSFEVMLNNNCLPCNIKFLIEGEEEIGSESIINFLENSDNTNILKSDSVIVSDTSLFSLNSPSISVSLRGILSIELDIINSDMDLHSGVYGGCVDNPIDVLCRIVSSLKSKINSINIPGFYDNILNISNIDKYYINNLKFDLVSYKKLIGVSKLNGEFGYSNIERSSIRPSLDINGIWGGYSGEGVKTILPSKASVKISIRTVPNQNVKELKNLIIKHLSKEKFEGIKLNIKVCKSGSNAVLINNKSVAHIAAINSFKDVWGKYPLFIKEGGSIPIISKFNEKMNISPVMIGFGLSTDLIHSPNENFKLYNFFKGIDTIINFYKHFSELKKIEGN